MIDTWNLEVSFRAGVWPCCWDDGLDPWIQWLPLAPGSSILLIQNLEIALRVKPLGSCCLYRTPRLDSWLPTWTWSSLNCHGCVGHMPFLRTPIVLCYGGSFLLCFTPSLTLFLLPFPPALVASAVSGTEVWFHKCLCLFICLHHGGRVVIGKGRHCSDFLCDT